MTWYDRAELYDTLFSWDPRSERAFVLGASERWGIAAPQRILEPMCGPGRMLSGMPGTAIGFDLNPNMVQRAHARDCRVFRADATDFAVAPASFDLAFCLIDSFRYLRGDDAAREHLRCVARALRPGAVYVIGMDITGDGAHDLSGDEWEAGGWRIRVCNLGDIDPATRAETMHVRIEGHGEVIEDFERMHTYSKREFEDLIDGEGSFELVAAFANREYDLDRPVELSEVDCSCVLVLKCGS